MTKSTVRSTGANLSGRKEAHQVGRRAYRFWKTSQRAEDDAQVFGSVEKVHIQNRRHRKCRHR